jgi:uncharacterized protein (TIGR02270 family)
LTAVSADHVLEEVGFLWLLRAGAVHAANIRLLDLVRLDERLEAHVDAANVNDTGTWAVIASKFAKPGAHVVGIVFAAAHCVILSGRKDGLVQVLDHVVSSGSSVAAAELVSALAWLDTARAADALAQMLHRADAALQAVSVAAQGARRSDPGPTLTSALANTTPLVRARAYRTTGQLGRTDLMANLAPGLKDDDPECRFWCAWAAARMGATEPLATLADIAWNNLPRAGRALDLLLRRLDLPQANAWLREFVKLPDRQRAVIRATGVIGDPIYIPWLIEHMADPATARLAGESFSMITGLDLAYRDLDRRPPADFQSGPNDDPADDNVALDEDENLPWSDPARIGQWWTANRSRFSTGTAYFLGTPKAQADWLEALSDAFQRQRHAAALELAIRQPDKAMFEVRARGRLQRQLIARARGLT